MIGAVEVLHDRGAHISPRWTVGSGHLMGPCKVLTAAHNVDYRSAPGEGEQLFIRCPDGREYTAQVILVNGLDGPDLAILEILDSDLTEGQTPQFSFAQVDRNSPTRLMGCSTIGFPRFKEKSRSPTAPRRSSADRPLRDTAHLHGYIPPGANLVSGLLELQVTAAPEPLPEASITGSPWEGISGAVVFVTDQRQYRALGVISEHHRPEGSSSLTLVPITSLNMLPTSVADRWWHELGVADAANLVQLPRPEPPPAYHERIRELIRRTPVLLDREQWLAELTKFATSSRGYQWVSGGPWAGKTALTAHLINNCPPNVDCVAYFLIRRLSDAHSGRFTTVVGNQLAWLLGEEPPQPADDPEAFIALWRRAVERAAQNSRHLLLVIDGIDEDVSRSLGRPSVAALIPTMVGEHAHILITSRRNYQLPADVDADSPLREVRPKELPDSPYAARLAEAAQNELELLLDRQGELAFDCIGLLAAAEGALSIDDLVQLTRFAGHSSRHYRIQRLVTDEVARVLEPVGDLSHTRYVFAHDQLRSGSAERLAQELDLYRQRLERWMNRYREAGWPEDTPSYLLDSYPDMLARHQPTKLRDLVSDFGYLDAAIARLGVDQVLITAHSASNVDPNLTGLSRCIGQQAHHLQPGDPIHESGYVTRQLGAQFLRLGEAELAQRAQQRLASLLPPQVMPRWTTGRTSPALLHAVPVAVGAVALSAEGRRVVTGGGVNGRPGELLLWDLCGKQPTSRPLSGHTSCVTAVALTPDGHWALTASHSDGLGKLFLFGLSNDPPGRIRLPDLEWTWSVGISADGMLGMTGGGTLVIWDLDLVDYMPLPIDENSWVRSAAMSADGRRVISAADNQGTPELLLWSFVANGFFKESLPVTTDSVRKVAISADGAWAISAGGDKAGNGKLLLWDLFRATSQQMLGHTRAASAVAISPDGQRAASGSGTELLLWDLSGSQPTSQSLAGHTREVEAVAISADNSLAVSGSAAEMLVWDLTIEEPTAEPLPGPAGWVRAVAMSGDGQRAVSGGGDVYSQTGELLLWDLSGEQPRTQSLVGPAFEVQAVAISADGQRALSGGGPKYGDSAELLLWDLSGEHPRSQALAGHASKVQAVAISGDGQRAVTGSSELLLWDLSGKHPTSQSLLDRRVETAVISADGQRVVAGTRSLLQESGEVLLWDLTSPESTHRPLSIPTATGIAAVAVSSDGQRALTGGGEGPGGAGELLLWDLSAEEPVNRSLPAAVWVRAVAISPDGRWGISCSGGEVTVWDIESARSIRTHTDGLITSASVAQPSTDTLSLMIGEWAGTVTAWTLLPW
ncbi:hypothetical protein ACF1AY_38895 [Streptomyces sp. NPDC014776]|uniref:hypothetical protein n=1 Tax=Streptomyces sp. NPDC014776 TaxID=3364909 RepID=UPI0036FE0931